MHLNIYPQEPQEAGGVFPEWSVICLSHAANAWQPQEPALPDLDATSVLFPGPPAQAAQCGGADHQPFRGLAS